MAAPASTKEIRALTGARGAASFNVVVMHAGFYHSPWVAFWMFPDSAVDLFFCLSGFSLCLAYRPGLGQKLRIWTYLRARIARIYPLYAASLALMWWMVYRHLGGSGYYPNSLYFGDAVRNFLMVNSWPLIGSGSNWNFPAWSLSVEAFCYLAVFPPLFLAMPALTRWSVNRRLCLLVALVFPPVLLFARLWAADLVSAHVYHPPYVICYWLPIIRGVALFAAGCVIYSFWVAKDWVTAAAGDVCDAVALVALFMLIGAFTITIHKDYLTLLAPALVLGLAANPRALVARALAAAPLHWLGEISYSLYLLHVPVDYELHHLWPTLARDTSLDVPLTLGAMLAASAASYYLFEMPMRRLIRGQPIWRTLQRAAAAPRSF